MKNISGEIRLSASDLSNHLSCFHATSLDSDVATGARPSPDWRSPDLWVLRERGLAHEQAYLHFLERHGLSTADLRDRGDQGAVTATCSAMAAGADVIAQATLSSGRWFGRADILRRVETPSNLGDWSYEVYDCKLTADTKAGTILQLALYSELIADIQGLSPESMYVVPPSEHFEVESYRPLDFTAYYRYIKLRLERAIGTPPIDATYPEPVEHCAVCAWFSHCDAHRRSDDHLSLVAGISRSHRKQLQAWNTDTVAALAALPIPLPERPKHGSRESMVRVREQARVQVFGRDSQQPVHEVLSLCDDHGFCSLPSPSAEDIFFDLEGDPFVAKCGREYLFGFVFPSSPGQLQYDSRWGLTINDERQAFEWFVDEVMERWRRDTTMHVYHFTSYETSALKRLMGRYATRENEIDQMLRAGLFVDLHTVLKRSVRASVEEYSLKALELFHNFQRQVPLQDARKAVRSMEHGLELGAADLIDDQTRSVISGYNADDCLSTSSLRDWLEAQRQSLVDSGEAIPRPAPAAAPTTEPLNDKQRRIAGLIRDLTKGVPVDPLSRTAEQSALKLLADLLDWHRREDKVAWWEFFRLRDSTDEELLDERTALADLRFTSRLSVNRNIPIDRYSFEKQECEIRLCDKLCSKGDKIGEVAAIDLAARTVDIKKTKATADIHPTSVFVNGVGPDSAVLCDALIRLAEWVTFDGTDAAGPLRAARDLLLRHKPRLSPLSTPLLMSGETTLDAAKRIVTLLQDTVLAIQGPPGAGKTYTAARMIVELIQKGKRVGVTSTSHKVIANLLSEVAKAAIQAGLADFECLQKVTDEPEIPTSGITITTKNADARSALRGACQVLGGTAWMWSSEEFKVSVDVLFVDEAGQMALANVLAVAQAANSVVLLGDPQQLEQPLKGSHPEGADASALEHLLAGAKTIPGDRGLFLAETWRLHPRLCAFTSEVFYEGRLTSHSGLELQRLIGHQWLGDSGLWLVPVQHEGNRNSSAEEVAVIGSIVDGLIQGGVAWDDGDGKNRPIRLDDILIVAPYNAQVVDLAERLPTARVGTVDKFQGQEAPVVIYSLTTSSPEEAPRGMEFLYSLNRLNVATSRAQAVVIVVCSPLLLQPDCRSPRQMRLANALCRYAELAQSASLSA